ncbi:5'-deoxynucleotidase Ygk1p [Monosporozyma servazzii]
MSIQEQEHQYHTHLMYDTANTTTWDPKEHIPEGVAELLAQAATTTAGGTNSSAYPLAFFHILQTLKLQKRTGWLDNGIGKEVAESISDHMHRMSLMGLILKNPNIDRHKCMLISLVHDVAESLVGDITPFDGKIDKNEKHLRELAAIEYICNDIVSKYNEEAGKEILNRWLDYEDQRNLEAVYAKDLDKFEMLVQCFEYEKLHGGKKDLSQFYSCVDEITTDEVKSWLQGLMNEREHFLSKLK